MYTKVIKKRQLKKILYRYKSEHQIDGNDLNSRESSKSQFNEFLYAPA